MFHTTLPTGDRKPGGVEVAVHRLSEALTLRGHEVTVLATTPAPSAARYRHHLICPPSLGRHAISRFGVIPIWLNFVDTSGFDVLHLHGDDWFYLRRALPTVRTFYGAAREEARYSTTPAFQVQQLLTWPFESLASRLATASKRIGPGSYVGILTDGALPIGVSRGVTLPLSRSPYPSILFVGAWKGRKRGSLLAQVFRREVRSRCPDAELWMVADRCDAGNGIRWIQNPTDEELKCLYQRAWVFCLPSSYEGFGIPYLEAMAEGTPVVACPNDGSRFVLDEGRCGLLAPASSLGETLVSVLTSGALRDSLSERGRARAAEFDWDGVAVLHERAYQNAVQKWQARKL